MSVSLCHSWRIHFSKGKDANAFPAFLHCSLKAVFASDPSSFWMKPFSVILRNNSYDPVGRRKVVKRTTHSFTGRCERREASKRKERSTGGGERYQNGVNSPGRYICHHLCVCVLCWITLVCMNGREINRGYYWLIECLFASLLVFLCLFSWYTCTQEMGWMCKIKKHLQFSQSKLINWIKVKRCSIDFWYSNRVTRGGCKSSIQRALTLMSL